MKWLAALLLTGLTSSAVPGATDPRSQEILRLSCSNRLLASELTLFANGTLRLRERDAEKRKMYLAELGRREAEDYRARLRAEGSPEQDGIRRGVSGEWVEQCRLTVELEPESRYSIRFSRVDTLPLTVSRLVAIADELMAEAIDRRLGTGFPVGYEPRIGDVVRRADDSDGEAHRTFRTNALPTNNQRVSSFWSKSTSGTKQVKRSSSSSPTRATRTAFRN